MTKRLFHVLRMVRHSTYTYTILETIFIFIKHTKKCSPHACGGTPFYIYIYLLLHDHTATIDTRIHARLMLCRGTPVHIYTNMYWKSHWIIHVSMCGCTPYRAFWCLRRGGSDGRCLIAIDHSLGCSRLCTLILSHLDLLYSLASSFLEFDREYREVCTLIDII